MLEGESGLLAVAPGSFRPEWKASRRQLLWPNEATALLVSAVEPDQLRGPQFHFAWCDEIAAWPKPKAAWDNLRMGWRLGRLGGKRVLREAHGWARGPAASGSATSTPSASIRLGDSLFLGDAWGLFSGVQRL